MRIRLAVPPDLTPVEQARALDAALEATTRAAEAQVSRGVPTLAEAVRQGRVRWRPEPPGDEHFDLPLRVLRRGWGDCDDLAPWHAASLRARGKDKGARARVVRSGPRRWHAVVERSDGSIDDPSEYAGMRSSVVATPGIGALWRPMLFSSEWPAAAAAVAPYGPGWAGRVDVPMATYPVAVSGVAVMAKPADAVRVAADTALAAIDDEGDERARARIGALADLLSGAPLGDVEAACEECGVGFAPLLPAAASLAAPLAQSLFPRRAAVPSASTAVTPASDQVARPGTVLSVPGGPIIVRF